jgi:hypothetical protein
MNDHIQISDVTPRIQYAADGNQIEFSYPFPIFLEEDLDVYLDDTIQKSGYAVLGAGTSYGGTVTFDTPPTNGMVVTLRRSLAIERTTDFHQSGAFRAKVINDELDHLTAALQQVANDVSRAVRLRSAAADANLELPSKDDRANKVLGFDASGDVITIPDSGGAGGGVTNHGQLTGLSDDDHVQYHNDARGDARYYTQAQVDTALSAKVDTSAVGVDVGDIPQLEDIGGGTAGLPSIDGSQLTGLPSGVTDHGALLGLGDNDHPQYFLRSAWFPSLKQNGEATGDGVTDDSSAWDDFIDAAITAGGGIIEPGTYRIPNATMQKYLAANLTLIGIGGREQTIIDYEADRDSATLGDATILFFLQGDNIRIEGIQFRRIPIVFSASDASISGFTHNSWTKSGAITGFSVTNCAFDRCVYPLFVRDRDISSYSSFSNFTFKNNQVLDCANGLYFYAISQHRYAISDNLFRITSDRTATSAVALDGASGIYAIRIDISNGDTDAPPDNDAYEARQVALSGKHTIANNIFEPLTWTGTNDSGVDVEIRQVRVTCQNDVIYSNNHLMGIGAANFSSAGGAELNTSHIYNKVICPIFTGNTFVGPLQGDLATTAHMLKLKGEGKYFVGAETYTKSWGALVIGNIFRQESDDTDDLSAISVYADTVTITGNTFQGIRVGQYHGVILHYSNTTGFVARDNTFIECRTISNGIFGMITFQEGGSGTVIDGVYILNPCSDDVGHYCFGVYVSASNPDEDIHDWQISNIFIKGASSSVTNGYVRLNAGTTGLLIDGCEISKLGGDHTNIGRGVWFEGFDPGDVSGLRLDADLAHATSQIQNPNSVLVEVASKPYVLSTSWSASPRMNFAATSDPGSTDDSTDGYAVGSHWINLSSNQEFVCVAATASSAVWKQTTT